MVSWWLRACQSVIADLVRALFPCVWRIGRVDVSLKFEKRRESLPGIGLHHLWHFAQLGLHLVPRVAEKSTTPHTSANRKLLVSTITLVSPPDLQVRRTTNGNHDYHPLLSFKANLESQSTTPFSQLWTNLSQPLKCSSKLAINSATQQRACAKHCFSSNVPEKLHTSHSRSRLTCDNSGNSAHPFERGLQLVCVQRCRT